MAGMTGLSTLATAAQTIDEPTGLTLVYILSDIYYLTTDFLHVQNLFVALIYLYANVWPFTS